MVPIKHIVFDVGQVLIHWDPEIPYRRLIPDEDRRAWFFANVCTASWNAEQDRGRPWEEAEALLISQYPGEEALIRAYRKHWMEMVPHALEDTVAILEELVGKAHDVTLLTNFAADTFSESQERFPFLTLPRGATVSGSVGMIKPDPAIYQRHTAAFALEPSATLFFDDSPHNVEAARTAGWQAELFTGAEQMRADLAQYRVL